MDVFVSQDISNEDLLSVNPSLVETPASPEATLEAVLESRETIEDKIFAIKCRIIDFTVRQWDISGKV